MIKPLPLPQGLLPQALLAPAIVGLTLLLACGGQGQPLPLPPQTVTAPVARSTSELPQPTLPAVREAATNPATASQPVVAQDAAAAPARATPPTASKPVGDPSLIVIGSGRGEPGETTNRDLVEAAQKERLRRQSVGPPVAVVTDEDIAEHARGKAITFAEPRRPDPIELAEAKATLDGYADEESYWRARALDIRQGWRTAHDDLAELEDQADDLRMRFYAEEDSGYRDREIKPAWDRAVDKLRKARQTIEQSQQKLDELYEDGRRAGALEGWLREGIELEPENGEISSDPDDDGGVPS